MLTHTKMNGGMIRICICGAEQLQGAEFILHCLANGDLFGSRQMISLVLHHSSGNQEDLQDMAQDLQDACYSHLIGSVETNSNLFKSTKNADALIMLTPTENFPGSSRQHSENPIRETVQSVQKYARVLNCLPNVQNKVVIFAGEKAVAGAGVLTMLVPRLSPHLVLGIDLLPAYPCQHGGAHHMAQVLSSQVRPWWTGVEESDSTILAISEHSIETAPPFCFLPLPVNMSGPCMAVIKSTASTDPKEYSQAISEFVQALNILEHSQHSSTPIFSKL